MAENCLVGSYYIPVLLQVTHVSNYVHKWADT